MKKQKLELGKKLFLNKEKISQLSKDQSANVLGGGDTCPSNCVVCYDTNDPVKCATQGRDCESCRIDCDSVRECNNESKNNECQTIDYDDYLCASVNMPQCHTNELC